MRIFLVRGFVQFIWKSRIPEAGLLDLTHRANLGIVDADLGGGLIKLWIARPGSGRSGGYRTILAYRYKDRAFFLYGYAKNTQSDVGPDDLALFRELGAFYINASEEQIERLVEMGDIAELRQT